MSATSPIEPVRSDYRYLKTLLSVCHPEVECHTDGFDKVISVFAEAGGSWEKLFKGSTGDLELLKKVLKIAVKKGVLAKKSQWGARD